MDSMALYYPAGHEKHYFYGHPECPDRVEMIKKGLEEIHLWNESPQISPVLVEDRVLAAIHDQSYLSLLELVSSKEQMLDPDTYTTKESWQLALNAAGGSVALVDAVWDRKVNTGFALTRPPGHHATPNRGMGFCLINNIAVAAEYLLQNKGAKKIAIIDLDLHHGNGTQEIFWNREEVSYISIHQAPFYPGTGALYDIGGEGGEGTTLNLPIPSFSGDQAYQKLVSEIVIPYLSGQKPEMILISFGFDIHWRDPLGSMQVSGECIYKILNDIRFWSENCCSGRLAVLLEGGYDLEAGRISGQAVGAALTNRPWEDSLGKSPAGERGNWQETLSEAKEFWGF